MNELNGDAEPQNVQSKSRYAFVFFQIKRKDIFTFYTINKIASLRSAFLTVFFYNITKNEDLTLQSKYQ